MVFGVDNKLRAKVFDVEEFEVCVIYCYKEEINNTTYIYTNGDVINENDFIKIEDIPSMAKTAAKEANHIYPVPVLKTAKEIEKYYYLARGE